MNHLTKTAQISRTTMRVLAFATMTIAVSGCNNVADEELGPVGNFVVQRETPSEREKRMQEEENDRLRLEDMLARHRANHGSCYSAPPKRSAAEKRVVTVIQPHARRDYGTDSGC